MDTGVKVISVIGTVNIDTTLIVDRVPDPGESLKARNYKQSTGGKGANAAISTFRSCHRRISSVDENGVEQYNLVKAYPDDIDVEVRLVAAVGDDSNALICRQNLESNGIDISGVRSVPNTMTGMSFCIVEQDSRQNRIMSHRGANDTHQPEDYMSVDQLAGGAIPDLLISHLALPVPVVERILLTAGKANIEILLNLAPAQQISKKLYKYLTHLVVNETEAAILSGREVKDITIEACPQISRVFIKKGARNVVITLGNQGAFFARIDEAGGIIDGHVPALNCEVVDTTGAGDTFTGTYASEYVRQKSKDQWDIQKAVERACAASTCTIGALGAQAAIPWADGIDSLLTSTSPPEIPADVSEPV